MCVLVRFFVNKSDHKIGGIAVHTGHRVVVRDHARVATVMGNIGCGGHTWFVR